MKLVILQLILFLIFCTLPHHWQLIPFIAMAIVAGVITAGQYNIPILGMLYLWMEYGRRNITVVHFCDRYPLNSVISTPVDHSNYVVLHRRRYMKGVYKTWLIKLKSTELLKPLTQQ